LLIGIRQKWELMKQPRPNTDNAHVIALNQALVDELKSNAWIQTPGVEAAFRAVLRHHFLPGRPLEEIYSDTVIPTKQDEQGQWISSSSQPAIMAIMLEQLGLEAGQKVLEIGAGTGYNAALMAHIVGETGRVVTIDIDEDLVETARENLEAAGFDQVEVVCADGGYGYLDAAPYDRIILTVGAPDIMPAWRDQLKPNGRIVLPLMLKGSMKSTAFEQTDDYLESLSVKDCSFMLLRGDFASIFSKPVQLGPDPNLTLELVGQSRIDSSHAYDLLGSATEDWPVNIEVRGWDVLIGSLWTWLSLREAQICKLMAKGHMVERNIVPPLIGIDGKPKLASTVALLNETGLAALMRPPGHSLLLLPVDKLFTGDQPFALFVRQFGSNKSIAQRLITQIQEWDVAGRPSFDQMRIRAYPKDSKYAASEREFVIEKEWTKLIIEWPVSSR
jgi:protein-L-isoaspartate(D-aspartate) O-methyltransferase